LLLIAHPWNFLQTHFPQSSLRDVARTSLQGVDAALVKAPAALLPAWLSRKASTIERDATHSTRLARYCQIHPTWPSPCIVLPRVTDPRCIGSVSDQSTKLETGKQPWKWRPKSRPAASSAGSKPNVQARQPTLLQRTRKPLWRSRHRSKPAARSASSKRNAQARQRTLLQRTRKQSWKSRLRSKPVHRSTAS